MSNNDPTKWAYFENLNVVEFLNLIVYQKDKQDEEAMKARLRR